MTTDEMSVPGFFTNPTNRCYFCKTELYSVAREHALRLGYGRVADGVNTDDLGDHRPGLIAAKEHTVVHPLVEADMNKADTRAVAHALGLDVWDKPAFACLSSRFPYGTQITKERLTMVGSVEHLLKELGFRQYRVRYHDDLCRIEVMPADLPRLVEEAIRNQVVDTCRSVGFQHVTVDLRGFRSGSLNEALAPPSDS
ncbi:MAG TPA: ATP-dependent sacrificial sulfur transferase LarE [Deltaproteobacteria bacterium]|nr:ATP-dependent sacrificial sulfur transferase LarE [Deltaproteobacteria bacterium]